MNAPSSWLDYDIPSRIHCYCNIAVATSAEEKDCESHFPWLLCAVRWRLWDISRLRSLCNPPGELSSIRCSSIHPESMARLLALETRLCNGTYIVRDAATFLFSWRPSFSRVVECLASIWRKITEVEEHMPEYQHSELSTSRCISAVTQSVSRILNLVSG